MTLKQGSLHIIPKGSLARLTFCWWRHNRLAMMSQWPDNCDANTWQVISNSLDMDFIDGDIHVRSCKNEGIKMNAAAGGEQGVLFVYWPVRLPPVVKLIALHTIHNTGSIYVWLICHNSSFFELGQFRKHIAFCVYTSCWVGSLPGSIYINCTI